VARKKTAGGSERFSVGNRRVDLEAHLILTESGAVVRLTKTECKLLQYLGSNPNQTVPVPQLVDLLWSGDPQRGSHSLRTVVKNVRRKMEPDPAQPKYLVLDRTFGYRLDLA
jgi:two-component system KDP operon response regulator KdpE